MKAKTELQFLRQVFQKANVQTTLLELGVPPSQQLDLGLREMLGQREEYERFFRTLLSHLEPGVLFRVTDVYRCGYFMAEISEREERCVLLAGPFLPAELTREELLEQAERHGIKPDVQRALEQYYGNLRVILPGNSLCLLLETFLENLWGEDFQERDLNRQLDERVSPLSVAGEPPKVVDPIWAMEMMERRYAMENELMQVVSQGQHRKAEQLMAGMSRLSLEQRTADPIRNLKNYCIIFNTLMRKAAERGGVHPLYLDQTSAEFAKKIEQIRTIPAAIEMLDQMAQSYCSLVNKHAMRHYSPPVQRTVVYVDANLTGELSLKVLAAAQNINASYLSSLFRKETGMTITEYVNRKRVKRALRLLGTTNLQIQTIAQHCGIPDVNYFCKIFKKYAGMTPKEYRHTLRS